MTRMEVFADRSDAGRRLGDALRPLLDDDTLRDRPLTVLGIPRGGLPVGVEVARELGAAFDVVVVRKLRSPHNPELAYGAVSADGHVEVDSALVDRLGLSPEAVDAEIADRRAAVERRLEMYREVVPAAPVTGTVAIVVDDGVATGGTARRACALARRCGAAVVILAVPTAPRGMVDELADAADRVVVLSEPAEFLSVDQAYQDFEHLDDEGALASLRVLARP